MKAEFECSAQAVASVVNEARIVFSLTLCIARVVIKMYLVMVAKKNRCSTKQASLHLSVFGDSAQSECPHYIEAHACTRRLHWDIRYKVLWIGKIGKHKGIGETKVLRNFLKNF